MNVLQNLPSDTHETGKSASVPPSTKKRKTSATPKSRVLVAPKRRKNRSEVWDHFEKLKQATYVLPKDDDYKMSKCKGCNTILICDSRYGTTNLKRHIKSCVKLRGQLDVKQMLMNASSSGDMSLRSSKIVNVVYRESCKNDCMP